MTGVEKLAVILEYGTVRIYDLYGEYIQFGLGQDAKEFGVLEAIVCESAIVALTGNFKFVVISDLDEPRPKMMADAGKSPNNELCVIFS